METITKVGMVLVLAPLIGVLAAFPLAWGLMLAAGIIHAQLLPDVLPAGYWAVWPLAWVVVTIGIGLNSSSSD